MLLKTNLFEHRCDETLVQKTHLSWLHFDIITPSTGVPFPCLLSVFSGLEFFGKEPAKQAM